MPLQSSRGFSAAPSSPVCLVSSCLLGLPTRYDGKAKLSESLNLEGYRVIPVCPEQLGGLPTPRPKQMLYGGDGNDVLNGRAKVINIEQTDVTAQFLLGAKKTLELADICGATEAFLKGRSPSCGCGSVWIDGKLLKGFGVTASFLKSNGIRVHEVD